VFQPPKGFAVNDAIPVVLKRGTHVVLRLVAKAPARFCALGGLRRQNLALARLEVFTNARHFSVSSP
jgi:hypothetical protein